MMLGLLVPGGQPAGAAVPAPTLYVSVTGNQTTGTDVSCASARYSSIRAAVQAASRGATVVVCTGTYQGQVVITRPLILSGINASVLAVGAPTGITVAASGVTVQGLIVKGAQGEGILVAGQPGSGLTDVTIKNNIVEGNDLGNPAGLPMAGQAYKECDAASQPVPALPGDCGEGIHLMAVSGSVVSGNVVTDNSGGVLLSDQLGPDSHNAVEDNTVEYNTLDGGITLLGVSGRGSVAGRPSPAAGGVYDNLVSRNVVIGNGTVGQGAGVLLTSDVPGGAVYGNDITGNTVAGSGLAGVTVHSLVAGQDLNANTVQHNTVGQNNLDGDTSFSPHLDLLASAVVVGTVSPLTITVQGNTLSDDTYGVWSTGPAAVLGIGSNIFADIVIRSAAG
jgi:nitrous oxidase accessory protein NosD